MRHVSRNPRKPRARNFSLSESDGLQAGDAIGNRQKFSETRINADDIGNRLSAADLNSEVRDDIGNSIGIGPTHQQSGVLASFEGRNRRRRDNVAVETRGSNYAVGGVNPLVSGNQALLSMYLGANDEESEEETISPIRPTVRVRSNSDLQEGKVTNRNLEKSGDSSDRWLRRLLEFEDEERQESLVQGDPKQKAMQARAALSQIFEKGEVMAAIGTEIVGEVGTKQSVLVSFEDIDPSVDPACRLSNVFSKDSLALLALNFLVNKIVNRVPEERVRVQVALRK